MYQVFFEISLQSKEFLFLAVQLILSLFHQCKLQFGFSQELSLWSEMNHEFDQCRVRWSPNEESNKINFAFTTAQRHCGSTSWCSSARSVTSVLLVKVSLCHFVCRSFCNWHSIAFWIQVSASLLLPAQSSVKDIKDPLGNYSLPGFKECKQITSHNYTGCVGLTKHITQKIRHVFCGIHHLRWITEVIQGVCTKTFKLATMHNGWIGKMLKINFVQIWICTAWLSVYVNRTHLEAFAFRIL